MKRFALVLTALLLCRWAGTADELELASGPEHAVPSAVTRGAALGLPSSRRNGNGLPGFRVGGICAGPDFRVAGSAGLPDFRRGYDLTSSLKGFLQNEVKIDVSGWKTGGLKPKDWPGFGSVQKTSAEFRNAYDTFAAKCVEIAKEIAAQ